MKSMKNLLLVLIVQLSFSSCSDDDPQAGCFQEESRNIVATITDATGTIREPGIACPDEYIIEPDEKVEIRPLGLYDPCNLNSEFQVGNTRVIFSGYVYESFENEDICADFFEITEIRFIDP